MTVNGEEPLRSRERERGQPSPPEQSGCEKGFFPE